ncbi:hypothetical protein GGR26_000194 [Lewinella marina]|uniref:Uncharacterized protein n=1 Tax=Neolewinella marina TaxID=438751 RepID=A0A2G0CK89_9BACT|nr:hypothetical protein [Neolewinella marina]NJB84449.1 hypothetical protein [Neolewinella marina]PHL00358.1 hypothetical protein CGL56_04810 [Neolewinella marina]
MQRYVEQLCGDLLAAAQRRRERPRPLADEYFVTEEERQRAELIRHFSDVERYTSGESNRSMYDTLGFEPEAFPPAERLTDHQLETLVRDLLDLWAAYRTLADAPQGVSARLLYPQLLKRMHDDYFDPGDGGYLHLEFCEYEPARCPWPEGLCSCRIDLGNFSGSGE